MCIDFEFPMRIDYYLLKSYQESIELIENIKIFCISAKCSILVGDNSINPYSFLRVSEKGEATPCFLRDDDLENIDNPKPYKISLQVF
jgi:hypothetical protein